MSRAVVLHCDNTLRPYRMDDFRQTLKDLGVIQEVGSNAAYQMSHVWLVNVRSDEAKKKPLEAGKLAPRGGLFGHRPEEARAKSEASWVSFEVSNKAIRQAFAMYGEVKDVARDRWRAAEFETAD